MKKSILVLLFYCFYSLATGQLLTIDSAFNFNNFVIERETYLNQLRNSTNDSIYFSEGSEYSEWQRFYHLWAPKLYPEGSFYKYYSAEANYYENYITNRTNNAPWHEIEPRKKPYLDLDPILGRTAAGTGPIEFITMYKSNPSFMLCGSLTGGVFYTEDEGENWHTGGSEQWDRSGCGYAVHNIHNPNIWYASCGGNGWNGIAEPIKSGGIYRTTNKGLNWQKIADKNKLGFWTIIFKIEPDHQNPDILYAATDNGLFVTYDVNNTNPSFSKFILPIPQSFSVLYPQYNFNFYNNNNYAFVYDFEIHPANANILYASVRYTGIDNNNNQIKVWRIMISSDGGATWDELPDHLPSNLYGYLATNVNLTLEVSSGQDNLLYISAGISNDDFGRLYVYNYNSNDLQLIRNNLNQVSFGGGHSFAVSNNADIIAFSNGIDLRKVNITSSDIDISGVFKFHQDIEDIIFNINDENIFYIATHGGIYKTEDGGITFQDKSNGLGVAQIWRIATSNYHPETVLAGLYHDGVVLSKGNYQENWQPEFINTIYADGQQPLASQDNIENNLYVFRHYSSFQSGKNGRVSDNNFDYSFIEVGRQSDFHACVEISKQSSKILFQASKFGLNKNEIFRSFNRGINNYEQISNFNALFTNDHTAFWILFNPEKQPTTLYAFMHVNINGNPNNKKFFLYRNDHILHPDANVVKNSWYRLPLPTNSWLTGIVSSDEDPNIVYLLYGSSAIWSNSLSLTGENMIFKINYSNIITFQYNNDWIIASGPSDNLTFNLPNTGVGQNGIVYEKATDGGLYVSTDVGVFYTNNKLIQNGTFWQAYGSNLPNVFGNGLEINYVINKIRIGTYG